MTARWVQTWLRLLVLANYASLPLVLFTNALGNRLGWNAVILLALLVLLAVFVLSFWRVHIATGCWRLVYAQDTTLDEPRLRLARSALALGFIWFAAVCLLIVYLKSYVAFNRLTALDFAALVYVAATLPSAVLAWRGENPLSRREALLALGRRVLIALAAAALLLALNLLVIRPWQHNWGATTAEIERTMPGDELVAAPDMNATRAVTVHATPAEIWPWLKQIGYKRGGFYSYDSLDNDGVDSARRIIPEYQSLEAGDKVPISEGAFMQVVSLERERSLVMQFEGSGWRGSTWVFGLYPQQDGGTRLISRLRVNYTWKLPQIMPWLLLDTFEIVMMRRCLLGIKERAEAGSA